MQNRQKPFSVFITEIGLSVRFRYRRYRDQHPKQQIPKQDLEANRHFLGEDYVRPVSYSPEELQSARRYKFIHPEFLPAPVPEYRDPLKEKLEREDMMKRRAKLDIPEFYVGSILAVTLSDPYADGFESRFVGICIERKDVGLRHNFTLRNVIDGQGIEIMYEMYNPTIKKIEVLKLEKRLDEELLYLRDAPPEYSTVPLDLEATPHPKGATVPINPVVVPLNPLPWHEKWEQRIDLKGFSGVADKLHPKRYAKAFRKQVQKPWEKYDLVKKYRESVPLEDQDKAYLHFNEKQQELEKKKAAELDQQIHTGR